MHSWDTSTEPIALSENHCTLDCILLPALSFAWGCYNLVLFLVSVWYYRRFAGRCRPLAEAQSVASCISKFRDATWHIMSQYMDFQPRLCPPCGRVRTLIVETLIFVPKENFFPITWLQKVKQWQTGQHTHLIWDRIAKYIRESLSIFWRDSCQAA